MTAIRKARGAITLAGGAQLLDPTSSRRINLKTLGQVRAEMSRVYRDVRLGRIDSSEGARMVFMLGQIGKLIVVAELEQRVGRLEGMNDVES